MRKMKCTLDSKRKLLFKLTRKSRIMVQKKYVDKVSSHVYKHRQAISDKFFPGQSTNGHEKAGRQ